MYAQKMRGHNLDFSGEIIKSYGAQTKFSPVKPKYLPAALSN